MMTQAQKGLAFRALHTRDHAFIIPNPWDVGTARLLSYLGFDALATTSAGYAFSVGQQDNTIGRPEMMAHVSEMCIRDREGSEHPHACSMPKPAATPSACWCNATTDAAINSASPEFP